MVTYVTNKLDQKPDQTNDTNGNKTKIEKLQEGARSHEELILVHDNAPAYKATPSAVFTRLGIPSDFHLFSSMGHALAEQHFDSYLQLCSLSL